MYCIKNALLQASNGKSSWGETDLVQDLLVEDSERRGCRTDWSEPWLPWSRPSPLTRGCGNWTQHQETSLKSLAWPSLTNLYSVTYPSPVRGLSSSSQVAPASLSLPLRQVNWRLVLMMAALHERFLRLDTAPCIHLQAEGMEKWAAGLNQQQSSNPTLPVRKWL